ncbi:MAG: translational GTPase TypA [Alphaproteobacteria bacterium]|nr:translational GTPase TypA [Alphaproteobacteria bacterium]
MSLRNIAIIAHVDHGKTTLIDVMLRQAGTFRENQQVIERVMDSNELERERGITILAKVTSLQIKEDRINIVDTPGHADFSGEVERILNMVDGVVVLVDAAEGPMPQTKFVLSKALSLGFRPIVVINKIDKQEARPDEVINEVFDLFAALDATDQQLDFPILYGSAKQKWMDTSLSGTREGMQPLFDMILQHVPQPRVEEGNFRMLVTTLEADPYLGRILTGRIFSGAVKPNDLIKAIGREGNLIETGRISKILAFRGPERQPIEQAEAGDIVAIAGLSNATVSHTLCDQKINNPLPAQPVDPPTLAMTFRINDGPLAGTEGAKVQSRVIRERLLQEAEGNIALRISETENAEAFEVAGRGELQLAILIETMRREGFELCIGRPHVLFSKDDAGVRMEPMEEVTIDVDDDFSGIVVQKLTQRRATLIQMRSSGQGRQRLIFHAPTRGLIGYQSELMSDTRGTALMNRSFEAYAPHLGAILSRHNGVLIANGDGEAAAYALWNLQDRGHLFIEPGTKVYSGMIVGEHTRENDLEINVTKSKKLTNVRASGKDENIQLSPPVPMGLDKALSFITDNELVEVTPLSIRLRKTLLDPNERKRNKRK